LDLVIVQLDLTIRNFIATAIVCKDCSRTLGSLYIVER